ncbi:ferredoxin reductase-like protein, partial [Imleria badia]
MFFVRRVKPALILSGVSATAYYSFGLLSDRTVALPLSPSRFTPSTLVESLDVSSNTKLLTLSVPLGLLPSDRGAFAPIYSIFIKDSDIQVERPYTPLEGIDENGHMKLWVKKYEHGEVGRWLHSRRVGDSIEIRGPVKTWSSLWQDGHWDQVVMISGGTGITPFYQLLHSVFTTSDTSLNARFTLLHASRSLADLPPSSMIQSLTTHSQKYPDRFQFHLFSDSTNDTSESHTLNIQRGRIGKSVIQDALQLTHSTPWWRRLLGTSAPTPLAPEKRVLVLVCGPEGMVSAIAGPYGRNNSQGKVGGILGELGLQSHQVWKL